MTVSNDIQVLEAIKSIKESIKTHNMYVKLASDSLKHTENLLKILETHQVKMIDIETKYNEEIKNG